MQLDIILTWKCEKYEDYITYYYKILLQDFGTDVRNNLEKID